MNWKLFGAILLAGSVSLANQLTDEKIVEALSQFQFDQLGHPQVKSDSILPIRSTRKKPHRLLVIPVQFSDIKFDRYKGLRNADAKNRRYLDQLLFSKNLRKPKEKTLTHYYYHQSRGQYYVTGDVFPVVTVDRPLSYYGRPIQNIDGSWKNDTAAKQLIEDSLKAAVEKKPDFPWKDYDIWDVADYDGDGNRDEPDGYIDHFILVFAGKGQSSCQGLYKLGSKFTPNVNEKVFETLTEEELACADRIWPHRFMVNKNIGKGPVVEGHMNGRGGFEVKDGLWLFDYNMQSEYTSVSTFIHEYGHSLGLPDIYARQTNNSTASWEAMSSTRGPYPQELSAWSRMVLGWLKPCVIYPRSYGGKKVQSVYLKTMNEWDDDKVSKSCDSAMVILPPKTRNLKLGSFQKKNGKQAAYTAQGNDMNHYLWREFDFSKIKKGKKITLEFDTWFEIEGDWDYLYVQAQGEDEEDFVRLLPTDKKNAKDKRSVMPAQKGHEGKGSLPGFTGRSGDMDGDGKVELNKKCNPKKDKKLAEDRVGKKEKDPCEVARWVKARFDLSKYAGKKMTLRFHYYTDGAAVENGALIDNVKISAINYSDNFEKKSFQGWSVEGFNLSSGKHRLAVPHFYLLEYRDPYKEFSHSFNYDSVLTKPGFTFYKDQQDQKFKALDVRYRPGVVAWYYNGSYLWSQNEPAQFGSGNGFLLVVDSNPQEFKYPSVPDKYFQRSSSGETYYKFEKDEETQKWLKEQFFDVMCFQRKSKYYPPNIAAEAEKICKKSEKTPVENWEWDDRSLLFGYDLINEYLPGKDREKFKSVGSLYDVRIRKGKVSYRLYDRSLRNKHSADAPFALDDFEQGFNIYEERKGEMTLVKSEKFKANSSFDDSKPERYLNSHLPFGGVKIPQEGLKFKLARPKKKAPKDARVKVYFEWSR